LEKKMNPIQIAVHRSCVTLGKVAVLLVVLMVGAASPSSAKTWVIQANGSGDAPTIQAGIDSAVTADIVQLADGTFTGVGNKNIQFLGKAITVTSMNGAGASTIDCEGSDRGFNFNGDEGSTSILSGVTIINGGGFSEGGGIRINSASPTITDCVIKDCSATDDGGGIRLETNSTGPPSNPTITNCEITGCMVTDGTSAQGGGIAFNGDSSPTISGCTITMNQAIEGGGIWGTGTGSAVITNNMIYGNTVTGPGFTAQGGGLGVGSLLGLTLTGNLIFANTATRGGGVYVSGSFAGQTVENNTVAENSATSGGSGVYLTATNMAFRKGIIAFNTGSAGITCENSGSDAIDCSVVFGNPAGNTICTNGDTDNVMADPQFCGLPGSNYYYLQSDSPAAPAQSACSELIGALPASCVTPTQKTTWGKIKSSYR
jgi:hypothetical protein